MFFLVTDSMNLNSTIKDVSITQLIVQMTASGYVLFWRTVTNFPRLAYEAF
jgi:hypothetical protein